jgi:glycerol kinase
VLYDPQGRDVAEARVAIATRRAGSDRVEHDADELATSLQLAAQDVCESAAARGRDVVAAGLACQRSTVVCWDRSNGRALSAALSWQDRRDAEFLDSLRPQAAWIRERTGLMLSPHYGANKLRWCLETLPEVRIAAAADRLAAGPLSSFLLHRLLEERPVRVDPSNAARTLLFDPATQDWVPELLAAFRVPAGVLPQPVPTVHAYGRLRVGEVRAWLNAGTGAFLQRAIDPDAKPADGLLKSVLFSSDSRVVCSLEGTVNGAASALEWLQSRVALDVVRAVQALRMPARARTPLFMNGVGGLGSPWWKAQFPAEFAVAFMVAVNLGLMRAAGPLASMTITGGLAQSDYLCQALADLAGLPVDRPALREATARGIAFLAAGCPPRWPAPALERRFAPAANGVLAARFERWCAEMVRRGA